MYQMNPYFQQPPQQIVKVNGENGAMAYQLAPNSSVLLLDAQNPCVWLKTTDGAGYPSLKCYDITEHKTEDIFKSLEERISRLEGVLNESNITSNESK